MAACAAARSTVAASRVVSRSSATRPSRSTTPSPSSRIATTELVGPASAASNRDQRSRVIHTTARAAAPRPRTSSSASPAPTSPPTASWSCSGRWSERPPVTRWSATRASRRSERASRSRCGSPGWRYPRATSSATAPSQPRPSSRSAPPTAAGRVQPTHPGACTSRRPPAPDFRSGSSISAIGPGCASRPSAAAASAPTSRSRRRGASWRTRRARSSTNATSPTTSRRSSSAVRASRSSSATASASFTVRTDWPSTNPASQSGYQSAPA